MTPFASAIQATDGYKVDHRRQYPEGTEFVFSNLTARSARLSNLPEEAHGNETVFFGLQQFIRRFLLEFWNESFFSQPVDSVVGHYTRHINAYLGPNGVGEQHLRELHAYGRLPITIYAVPEGTAVPIQVASMLFHNTLDRPEFFWVTNYLETLISCELWKPITSATTARAYRRLIEGFASMTGGSPDFVPFQAHDFSFRGCSGYHDACVVGAAHLTSFVGTDTVPALPFIEKFYTPENRDTLIGASVPASEHSVMCMGTKESEIETFRRFINEIYPTGIVSIVSDTWDFWQVITEFSLELKDEILAREGKTVFRPDSGDPVKIVCGYSHDGVNYPSLADARSTIRSNDELDYDKKYDVIRVGGQFMKFEIEGVSAYGALEGFDIVFGEHMTEAEVKGAIECLWDIFGGTVTPQGYRTLDSHVGLIYGDSITYERCQAILQGLADKGFSSDNIVFGVGSYTYQYVTRDTYGMAVKATFGIVDGEYREIFKDPKTGSGKKSAKGLISVDNVKGLLVMQDEVPFEDFLVEEGGSAMMKYLSNGVPTDWCEQPIEEIRARIEQSWRR